MQRALALAHVRTGAREKAVRALGELQATNDYNCRQWQILVLALPRSGGPLGLTGVWRATLDRVLDDWYERDHERWEWADRVVITELRKQGGRTTR
jgi:hypothetical protein